ncbi:hypothetical protein JR316_0012510 [Psilocybe cubensis]|uniref:Uncharacterized protein n=1 Tax=Psilocybe cubensis TaxID=181762 RepID=A0ACB8GK13_PSICU|nr:hypothetical protein JR316_0012510 [Psilocybe cubensis]KAH9475399.1 hypothetical protein JR316_0012510 [Psilocybe cubensis]
MSADSGHPTTIKFNTFDVKHYKFSENPRRFETSQQMQHLTLPPNARTHADEVTNFPFETRILWEKLEALFTGSHPLCRMIHFLRRYEDWIFCKYDAPSSGMRAAIQYRLPSTGLRDIISETPCVTSSVWEQTGSLFAIYRLLDIITLKPEYFGPSISITVPRNEPQIIDDLKDWPSLLRAAKKRIIREEPKAHKRLTTASISNASSTQLAQDGSPEATLLLCLARNHFKSVLGKIVGNVYCASLHYQVLLAMRGVKDDEVVLPDIPTDTSTFVNLYASGHPDAASFLSEITPSHLKIPLHIALFISPILLFSNTSWYSRKCDREQLLKASKALGNHRPPALLELEMEIWRIIANQNCDIYSELRQLVSSKCWVKCEQINPEDHAYNFFRPNTTVQNNTNDTEHHSESNESIINQHQPIHPRDLTSAGHNSDIDAEGDDDHEVNPGKLGEVLVPVKEYNETTTTQPPDHALTATHKPFDHATNSEITEKTYSIIQYEKKSDNASAAQYLNNMSVSVNKTSLANGLHIDPRLDSETSERNTQHEEERDDATGGQRPTVTAEKPFPTDELYIDRDMDSRTIERITQPEVEKDDTLADQQPVDMSMVIDKPSLTDTSCTSRPLQLPLDNGDNDSVDKQTHGISTDELNRNDNDVDMEDGSGSKADATETSMANVVKHGVGGCLDHDKPSGISEDRGSEVVQDQEQNEGQKDHSPNEVIASKDIPVSSHTQTSGKATTPKANQRKNKKKRNRKPVNISPSEVDSSGGPSDNDENDYIDVDLFDSKIDLDVVSTPKKFWSTVEWVCFNAIGTQKTFRPVAHSQDELDNIHRFLAMVEADYIDGLPMHIARPDESCFMVINYRDHRHPQPSLDDFAERNIVIFRNTSFVDPDPNLFYRSVRHDIGDITSARSIEDLSVDSSHRTDRIKRGTLLQVVQAARTPDHHGKILNTHNIPLPFSGANSFDLSTDGHALRATAGSWKYKTPPPFGDISWGLVSTEGAFSEARISPNGFCTVIKPTHGLNLCITMRPRHPDRDLPSNQRLFLGDFLDYDAPEHHTDWIYEAIVLDPQSELICLGGHFYSSACLENTLTGIIHNFVAGDKAANTNRPTARFFLQQIMNWFYKTLIEGDRDPTDVHEGHIPLCDTQTGYTNMLALCIYMLFANVLDYDTYRNPDQIQSPKTPQQLTQWIMWDVNALNDEQRKACMFARGQAIVILDWLCKRTKLIHYLNSYGDNQERRSKASAKQFHNMMIRHYARTIMSYTQEATSNGVHGAPFCTEALLKVQVLGACNGELNKLINDEIGQSVPSIPARPMLKLAVICLVECNNTNEYSDQLRTPKELMRLGASMRDMIYTNGLKVKLERVENTKFERSHPSKKPRY